LPSKGIKIARKPLLQAFDGIKLNRNIISTGIEILYPQEYKYIVTEQVFLSQVSIFDVFAFIDLTRAIINYFI